MINWPMNKQVKKNGFVLLATDHGSMIVNRFDWNYDAPSKNYYGVSMDLLNYSVFDAPEINLMILILTLQRQLRGDGVVMIDGGANIGVHSLTAGRVMQGWGSVLAFEAQERVFYALAGNVALNNLFNVRVRWTALAQIPGVIDVPVPDYLEHGSFGSLEMQYKPTSENIGQSIDPDKRQQVVTVNIDSLDLDRLDFFKLVVEGMEEQVLLGAVYTIDRYKPVIHVEHQKTNVSLLRKFLESHGYVTKGIGPNTLAIHKDDAILQHIPGL